MNNNTLGSTQNEAVKIKIREKVAYGFGDVACNVVFALTMSLATYFYTIARYGYL